MPVRSKESREVSGSNLGYVQTSPLPDIALSTRSQRRRFYGNLQNAPYHLVLRINELNSRLYKAGTEWNGYSRVYTNVADRVSKAPPYSYTFASVIRQLPDLLRDMQASQLAGEFQPDPQTLKVFELNNYFELRRNGVSMLDIESMQLPLKRGSINRINKFFQPAKPRNPFVREHPNLNIPLQLSVMLAAQQFARPDQRIHVPDNVKPFNDRMVNYLDYWTALILNPPEQDTYSGVFDEARFVHTIRRSREVIGAIGIFLPARLGITPSSAIKLFNHRIEQSPLHPNLEILNHLNNYRFWNPFRDILAASANLMFRANGWPRDLEAYQFYNPEADIKSAEILKNFYEGQIGDMDPEEISDSESKLMERFGKYRVALRSDILNAGKKRMIMAMPDEHCISQIILTSQNRETLIIILRFKEGGGSHLTLEVGGDGSIYGFPQKILEMPGYKSLVMVDVVQSVLDKLGFLHPSVEPKVNEASKIVSAADQSTEVLEDVPKNGGNQTDLAEGRIKRKKVNNGYPGKPAILTPIKAYLLAGMAGTPEPRQANREAVARDYRLVLLDNFNPSEEDIERFIKGEIRNLRIKRETMDRDVRAMVESLREDPYGPGIGKMRASWVAIPTESGASRRVLKWRFRADQRIKLEDEESKRLRVVYVPIGNDKVAVLEVLNHDDFNKKYTTGTSGRAI